MEAGTTTESWGRAHAAVAVALFLCLFAAQAGLIVLTPVLSKVADDFDVSTATAGQLRMVSGLTAGLAAIALGTFARRLSLRRTILVGAAGLALASLASATAPTFVVLALAQMLLGLSVAALLIGGTVAAAEWVPQQHRTRVLSWALVGPPAAWIVGMPLIGAIGEVGWRWAWLVFPLVSAVVAGVTVARRPETPRAVESDSLTEALRDPPTARWILGELLSSSAWIGTLVFSGALFTESYGVTSIVTGLVLAVAAGAYAAGNVFFRRVVECRARLLIVRMSLLMALGVALFGLVRPAPWVSARHLRGRRVRRRRPHPDRERGRAGGDAGTTAGGDGCTGSGEPARLLPRLSRCGRGTRRGRLSCLRDHARAALPRVGAAVPRSRPRPRDTTIREALLESACPGA